MLYEMKLYKGIVIVAIKSSEPDEDIFELLIDIFQKDKICLIIGINKNIKWIIVVYLII